MLWTDRLSSFYLKVRNDNRISPTHISLYFALLHEASNTGLNLIIPVRDHLMVHAKVYSSVTYHRCLKELNEYGYIDYRPSYAVGRTRIELIELGP